MNERGTVAARRVGAPSAWDHPGVRSDRRDQVVTQIPGASCASTTTDACRRDAFRTDVTCGSPWALCFTYYLPSPRSSLFRFTRLGTRERRPLGLLSFAPRISRIFGKRLASGEPSVDSLEFQGILL